MAKKVVTLVSGNQNKVDEMQYFFPEWTLKRSNLELVEPQTLDILEVCRYKAKRAFTVLGVPVMVEDTEFCLDALEGLPGPFIKFFELKLGKGALVSLLKGHQERGGKARSCVMIFDGKSYFSGIGTLEGTVVESICPGEGFGFDCCFIPKGETRTLSQLGLEKKNEISHRRLAIEDLKKQLVVQRNSCAKK